MSESAEYKGVIVPMVTPFKEDMNVDEDAVRRIVDHLIDGGVDGIFAAGTTGEAASISAEQKKRLVKITAEHTDKRAVVYAGISGNCFEESVTAAADYVSLGADVLVAHPPFFYPLSDQETINYFSKLADGTEAPLIVYNIPKTTGMSVSLDVIEQLSRHPNIVGVKDSENTEGRLEEAVKRFTGRSDFAYIVGCAVLSAKSLSMGAAGIVPSTGNLRPELYKSLYDNAVTGNVSAAEKYQQQTDQLSAVYQKNRSLGQSLAALKAAMYVTGLCGPTVLPPFETLDNKRIEAIKKELAAISF